MKVSDYVLDFLVSQNVTDVFLITGGVLVPMVDAFHGRKDIRYICTQHEQGAAMAADGYARMKGLGCAMATSGPGATNLVTGIGCSYFDSIPVLFITGQVNTHEARGTLGVRQRGFQETDIVSIVRPITKLSRMVDKPEDIRYALEQAVHIAREGRPGPVLLDIPIDVQMAEVPENMIPFCPPTGLGVAFDTSEVADLIAKSDRPVLIYGEGCRKYGEFLRQFIELSGIPCLPSWAALDLVPHDHPLFVSTFGVYGHRAGNYAVQNADLVLAIGTRLDGRMTGAKGFAPKAVKVVVDLDIHEAAKNSPDVMIIADAGRFLRAMNEFLTLHEGKTYPVWVGRIEAWKEKYPITYPETHDTHPVEFVRLLRDQIPDDAIVIPDSGGNLSWFMQSFVVRKRGRVFSAFGYSPMGYSLPAAIGASVATGKPVVAIMGDGAMQMNIQELHTLKHYNIPVKCFVVNNDGYGIIRQFQDELCEGRYEATEISPPDFQRIAEAYGLFNMRVINRNTAGWMPKVAMDYDGPVVVDVLVDRDAKIYPKTRYGNPIERQHPLLDEAEHLDNMRG